jgi:seryl-tRNA synthetase
MEYTMLDLQRIREFPDLVKQGIADKKCRIDIDAILGLDIKRREVIKEGEKLSH